MTAADPTIALSIEGVSLAFEPMTEFIPKLRRKRARQVVPALNDVTFQVKKGEAFGIIGRNGAGKSTLMRVMAGTLLPDQGRVEVDGKLSTLLQLGAGFNAELSGYRNIYLGCLAAGLRRTQVEDIIDDVVEFSELGEAIWRPLKTYSSGMQSRLSFSIGIQMRPDILLLDEVLAVGDRSFRQKSLEALDELLESAGTIVFVSHSLPSVKEFCTRAMWLDAGRIRARGEPDQVVDRYKELTKRDARRRQRAERLQELADGDPLERE